jgi:HPt (histidine-containing phosphotransfer) domain-containing protein
MLRRVVDVFVATAGKQVAEVQSALAAGDFESVRRIAHSLRASFGNVGAAHLAKLAADLERSCVRADYGAAHSLGTAILRGHPLAVDALQQQVRSECA